MTGRWEERAACGSAGFAFVGWEEGEQKKYCNGCPVRNECLTYALQHEAGKALDVGWPIYGGLTRQERDKLRDRQSRAARKAAA